MATQFRIDPRIRALGKARIDVTRRALDEQEWQEQWREPRYPFPFAWTDRWKQTIEYKVDDYAAEVGFLIDVLGLPVSAFSPSYAMFTSPGEDFNFSVVAARPGEASTPPEALRIQFRVQDILRTAAELERRGIVFEQRPGPNGAQAASEYIGYFRTPHGICIDLWGPAPAATGRPDYAAPAERARQQVSRPAEQPAAEAAQKPSEAAQKPSEAAQRPSEAPRPHPLPGHRPNGEHLWPRSQPRRGTFTFALPGDPALPAGRSPGRYLPAETPEPEPGLEEHKTVNAAGLEFEPQETLLEAALDATSEAPTDLFSLPAGEASRDESDRPGLFSAEEQQLGAAAFNFQAEELSEPTDFLESEIGYEEELNLGPAFRGEEPGYPEAGAEQAAGSAPVSAAESGPAGGADEAGEGDNPFSGLESQPGLPEASTPRPVRHPGQRQPTIRNGSGANRPHPHPARPPTPRFDQARQQAARTLGSPVNGKPVQAQPPPDLPEEAGEDPDSLDYVDIDEDYPA